MEAFWRAWRARGRYFASVYRIPNNRPFPPPLVAPAAHGYVGTGEKYGRNCGLLCGFLMTRSLRYGRRSDIGWIDQRVSSDLRQGRDPG